MDMRSDPMRVLAEVLPAMYAAAARHGTDARLTVGIIETSPGSPNTVPGRLRFTVDLRHPDGAQYRSLRTEVESDVVRDALARQALRGEHPMRLGGARASCSILPASPPWNAPPPRSITCHGDRQRRGSRLLQTPHRWCPPR